MDRLLKRKEMINILEKEEQVIDGILSRKLQLLVVGGFAFTAHLNDRLTHDIDFVNELDEDEDMALNLLINATQISINNRASNKRSYGDVYTFADEYVDENRTIELNNIIIKSPTIEYLIASKFFDDRPTNNDALEIGVTNKFIDKQKLEEIIIKIYNQNNPIINAYYRGNNLKIGDFYRAKG